QPLQMTDQHGGDLSPAVPLAGSRDAGQDLSNEQSCVGIDRDPPIAIAAARARLTRCGIAEVAQNRRTEAAGRLRVGHHAPKLLVLDLFSAGDLGGIDGEGRAAGNLLAWSI